MGFASDSVGDSACFYIRGAVRQKFLQSVIHSWRGHSSGQMNLILVVVIGLNGNATEHRGSRKIFILSFVNWFRGG